MKFIASLKLGKACGQFSMPIRVMKIQKHVINNSLEIVFNASFSQGIVLSKLKIARVTPIFKKGYTQSVPDNYIDLFRYYQCLKKYDILYEKQFGFRPHFSTSHAILCIIDKIQQATEERSYSWGIFLDFRRHLIQLIIIF